MNSAYVAFHRSWLFILIGLICSPQVGAQLPRPGNAQTDTAGGARVGSQLTTDPIVIVRRYKPQLAESVKWQMVPNLPTMPGDSVSVRFEPLKLSMPTPWVPDAGSLPALPAAPPAVSHKLWWEAGAGNVWGTHGALDYRSTAGKKLEWGCYARHDGARGSIRMDGKEWKNVRSYDGLVKVDGRLAMGRAAEVDGAVYHQRLGRSLFSRDTSDVLNSSLGYQSYQKWGGQAGVKSSFLRGTWWGGARVSAYTLGDGWKQTERNLRLSADLEGKLGAGSNRLELVVDATRFQDRIPEAPDGGVGELRRVVWLRERMRFPLGRWEMTAGFQLALQGTGEVSSPRLFPHLEGSLPSVSRRHRLFLGLTGDVERVSFDDVVRLNPFVSPNPELRNTVNRMEVYAGARGQLGAGLHYHFRTSVRRLDDALFFLNQVDSFNRIIPVYDASTEWGVSGGIEQVWGRTWRFSSGIDYTLPKPNRLLQPWMTPTLRSLTAVQWSPTEKLSIRGELNYLNGIFVQQKADSLGLTYRRLPAFHNYSVQFNYRHRQGLEFFLHAGNLASVHYFRWFGYPTFGTQLLIGLRQTL